ncbi:hypothetical protein BDM02DRAFT_3115115 [Thelephora ganbajun]|uniref:Uncharacterized protein n=1 Tax=Thelephora ganbajun TaxID=370292 RepID=A0ACB6ZH39_THEGA|nr:hypothetical protein BDM02DRAFT_3115115 [Thelephora ganbajun]
MISTNSPWRFALVYNVPTVRRSLFILLGVSSKHVEARADPLRRGIGRGERNFAISQRPILPCEENGCSFFQTLMVTTTEELVFI